MEGQFSSAPEGRKDRLASLVMGWIECRRKRSSSGGLVVACLANSRETRSRIGLVATCGYNSNGAPWIQHLMLKEDDCLEMRVEVSEVAL